MRKSIGFLVILLGIASCQPPAPATPDIGAALPVLTAAESVDDSVFSDGSIPSSWENAGFSNPLEFKAFLKKLQYWVANEQRDSIIGCIRFPLRQPVVNDAAHFLAAYEQYFTPNVKSALEQQNLKQIFRNASGAMLGTGQIWFIQQGNTFKIISINP